MGKGVSQLGMGFNHEVCLQQRSEFEVMLREVSKCRHHVELPRQGVPIGLILFAMPDSLWQPNADVLPGPVLFAVRKSCID